MFLATRRAGQVRGLDTRSFVASHPHASRIVLHPAVSASFFRWF